MEDRQCWQLPKGYRVVLQGMAFAGLKLDLCQCIGDEIQAVLRRLDWIWVYVENGVVFDAEEMIQAISIDGSDHLFVSR